MLNLTTPIENLGYVGPRNAPRLKRLGIKTVRDLLWHFPSRYEDYSQKIKIGNIFAVGTNISTIGEITGIKNTVAWKRRMSVTDATIADETGIIHAIWFNQPYLEKTLSVGSLVSLSGKTACDKKGIYLSNPAYEKLATSGQSPETNFTHTGRLVPVYPETEGVSSKYLRLLIRRALAQIDKLSDSLPVDILRKNNFPDVAAALNTMHFPKTLAEAELARQRFAFEELLFFQLRALRDRRLLQTFRAPKIVFDKEPVGKFVKSLPFALTNDQRLATYEILKDLERDYPMNRLLNGDVGSGKTVVALIAAYQTAQQDWQAVFMAPTEILAKQHYQTITELLNPHDQIPMTKQIPNLQSQIKIGLLTGSEAKQWPYDETTSEKISKKLMQQKIAKGEIDIVIGTHAVIQKNVKFKNLGLVIIDEQHRFGIEQRAKLVRGQLQANTPTDADGLLFEDLTYKIRKAIFAVRKNLGLGHKENIYQKALEIEFTNQGIDFEKEKIIDVRYDSKIIGIYRPDFVVDDKVIIELKALPFVGKIEKEQVWHYLKGSEYQLALLVNFSPTDASIDRIIFSEARLSASGQHQSALCPHLLSMTATPIPRTLALTIYGDLDVSLIKEKPKGRQEIITRVVPHTKRNSAYRFIEEQIKNGRQIFVICPRIERPSAEIAPRVGPDSAAVPLSDLAPAFGALPPLARPQPISLNQLLWADVKAVTAEYEKLNNHLFPHRKVAMLHGKLKPKEKNEIMTGFKNKHYDILVSTSVVEVGVDIPNATIMMIESAERFGLAQLHQFRGRVGRGRHQSYCLLFTSGEIKSTRRLRALEKTNDGFILAEADLKLRGPGEFTGIKQSGLPDLAMASLSDIELIKKARLEAKALLQSDPTLRSHPMLLQCLSEMQKLVHFE